MADPTSSLSPGEMQRRLDLRLARSLQPLAWALAAAFAFFTGVTLAYNPPGATLPLALLDGAGALLTALFAWRLRRREPRPEHAHAAAALLLAPPLVASLAALKLLHLAVLSTNVMLVMVAAATMFLDLRWTLGVLAASILLWIPVALSEGLDERWLNAGFALVAAGLLGVAIQVARVRNARHTEALLASNLEKTRALEAAARAQRDANAHLRIANESLEAFTFVVSHDLKEPVRALNAYLDEAAETQDARERAEDLRRAREQAQSLDKLLRGLLEWSRASLGAHVAEPVRVADVLADPAVQVQYRALLDERGARLVVADDLPTVLASTPVLGQILGNLIVNAIKHNPRASPTVRVLAGAVGGGRAEILVEDDGPGFPEAVKERMRQLKNKPQTVRGGFGLAITRRAVERLGGELRLDDAPGGGSRVRVLLPAAPDEAGKKGRGAT